MSEKEKMGFNHDVPRTSFFDCLAEAIFAAECPGIRYTPEDQELYRKAAKAAWMELHAPVEPVAWRWKYQDRAQWNLVYCEPPFEVKGGAIDVQPLYAYPFTTMTMQGSEENLSPATTLQERS